MKPKDPQKEEKIKSITLDIVFEKGLAGIKMADIAKQANLSPSNLYIYFANKQDLVTCVFFDTISRINQDIQHLLLLNKEDYKGCLFQLFKFVLQKKVEKTREFAFFRQFTRSPYFKEEHHARIDEFAKDILNIFHYGQQKQLIKSGIEVELLIALFDGTTDKLTELHLNRRIKIDTVIIERSFSLVWDALRK